METCAGLWGRAGRNPPHHLGNHFIPQHRSLMAHMTIDNLLVASAKTHKYPRHSPDLFTFSYFGSNGTEHQLSPPRPLGIPAQHLGCQEQGERRVKRAFSLVNPAYDGKNTSHHSCQLAAYNVLPSVGRPAVVSPTSSIGIIGKNVEL